MNIDPSAGLGAAWTASRPDAAGDAARRTVETRSQTGPQASTRVLLAAFELPANRAALFGGEAEEPPRAEERAPPPPPPGQGRVVDISA